VLDVAYISAIYRLQPALTLFAHSARMEIARLSANCVDDSTY